MTELADTRGRVLRDLRISVTDRCNFRCRYCMPVEIFGRNHEFLPHSEILSFEEITKVARIFVDSGVTKLRLTGGEPLLRRDLPNLVGMLATIPGVEDIALTTNGVYLPKLAAKLKSAGLNRITVSLDAVDEPTFGKMNGVGAKPSTVIAGIESALSAGLGVKINSVVQKDVNEQEVRPLARLGRKLNVPVRFIEYMDVGNANGWEMSRVVSAEEILTDLRTGYELTPAADQTSTETALRYNYPDGRSGIGIIASVTRPFCRGCGRLRLSAKGELFTCLFGEKGFDLKTPLRAGTSDGDLQSAINQLWTTRTDNYSEVRTQESTRRKVEMSYIGG